MTFARKTLVLAGVASMLVLGFNQSSRAADNEPALRNTLPASSSASLAAPSPERIKRDWWLAYRMAKAPWLDKVVEADPRIVAAICSHPGPAKQLAQHQHLDKIAEADHYTCRRLTQWNGATEKLVRSKWADKVIALDPQGMVFALNRNPKYARLLARSPMFSNLTDIDRDWGRDMAKRIK
ncbi:MAG: hypothetical protein K2X77_28470 [Candidatus Obscuribacterales bacterium]|jgi:hypothetical protein|nr:hypothetical protein [Candidatus Obscuribacterales bacterium]